LLTTDGIHGEVPDTAIRRVLSENAGPQGAADALGAVSASSRDNRSAIILHIRSLPDADVDEVYRRLAELPIPPDLKPGQSLDGLRVERILSASRHSQLYQVTDTDDGGRPLVMKTPSPLFADEPSFLERFALEEWIGLRTDSPFLAKAVRRPRPRRFLYYAMEPVEGRTLSEWSRENPKPSVEEVIRIISQVIEGVRALHRRDTLHQDLKPDNILIDADGSVKIVDFGSCRVGGIAEISVPFERGEALGTLDFSAPEYRLGTSATSKADLFSIAAIAHWLLTGGQHPYGKAWERAATFRDFATLEYLPAAAHHPMVPLWMDGALRKALSIRPEHRQDSMSEFLHNLRQPDPAFLTSGPLPFAQRNPLLFWKILALAALLGWLLTWIVLS
jgi:eukaryotic-like serine/threonine-protein kinase